LVPKAASAFASVELGLGVASYLISSTFHTFQWQQEMALLAETIIAVGFAAATFVKQNGNKEALVVGATGLLLPFFARLTVVGLSVGPEKMPIETSLAIGLVVFSYGTVALAAGTRWRYASFLVWPAIAFAAIWYGNALMMVPMTRGLDAALATSLLFAALGASFYALQGFKTDSKAAVLSLACIGIGGFATRLAELWLTSPYVGMQVVTSLVLGATLCAAAGVGETLLKKWVPGTVAAWALLAFAVFEYYVGVSSSMPLLFVGLRPLHAGLDFGLITLILAVFAALSIGTARFLDNRGPLWIAASLVGWFLFTRWALVAFQLGHVTLQREPSVTIAWTLYGTAILALGFVFRAAQLRYVSFAVFGMAVAKVLLVDLIDTDPMVKVGVLLGLGLCLLGGAYAYVRARRGADAGAV
jgi:hypothetical protein